jgi:hypothetical protein
MPVKDGCPNCGAARSPKDSKFGACSKCGARQR